MKKLKLYIFDWVGGGYNQVTAFSEASALSEVAKKFKTCGLRVDMATLRPLSKDEEVAYWRSFDLGGSRWTD